MRTFHEFMNAQNESWFGDKKPAPAEKPPDNVFAGYYKQKQKQKQNQEPDTFGATNRGGAQMFGEKPGSAR